MAAKLTDRPLTFTVPVVGTKCLLPQQTAVGMEGRIYQVRPGYFNVSAYAVVDRARPSRCAYAIVRAAMPGELVDGGEGWIVQWRGVNADLRDYKRLAYFKASHLREALAYTVRLMAVEYVVEHGHPGQLTKYAA